MSEYAYCLFSDRRPYRCASCHARFWVRERYGIRRLLHHPCLLIGVLFVAGAMVAFENRTSHTLLKHGLGTEQQDPDAVSEHDRKRHEFYANQLNSIVKVTKAIRLHRSGEEGEDVVAKVTRSDDPLFLIAYHALREAGVSDDDIRHQLKEWTKGKNILEIAQKWVNEGKKIKHAVEQAESHGLPVRNIVKHKDTLGQE